MVIRVVGFVIITLKALLIVAMVTSTMALSLIVLEASVLEYCWAEWMGGGSFAIPALALSLVLFLAGPGLAQHSELPLHQLVPASFDQVLVPVLTMKSALPPS